PVGSTFRTVDEQDLVVSPDRWFRPVWTAVGPDGGVYMADWYDTRLSHVNPVDDWDKARGRLYRFRPAGKAPGLKPFNLSSAGTERLLELLDHPNEWFRKQAVLEIGWRGLNDAVPELRR
ncbi:MAG: dehydrogenase, partial [Verrucomicrobiota bacterium]